jgi:hypothetical protein
VNEIITTEQGLRYYRAPDGIWFWEQSAQTWERYPFEAAPQVSAMLDQMLARGLAVSTAVAPGRPGIPYALAAPATPWYRKKWVWAVAAGIVAFLVIGAATSGSQAPAPTAGAPTAPQAPQDAPEPAPAVPVPNAPEPPSPAEVKAACVSPIADVPEDLGNLAEAVGPALDAQDASEVARISDAFALDSERLAQAAESCQDPGVAQALRTYSRSAKALSESCRLASEAIRTGSLSTLDRALTKAVEGRELLQQANDQLEAAS